MNSVLIIVTSSNKKSGFGVKTYNEQEIGLARALSKKNYTCGIAYYGGNVEKEEILNLNGNKVHMYLFKGYDFLKNAFFKNYNYIFKQYDILMPITYDHYETYHIAMSFPEKTVVYHGTYYASFNKGYNFKCWVVDKFFLSGYKKKNIAFVTKNKLAADFLNNKGIKNTKVIGVGFDAEQMSSSQMLESDLSGRIQAYKDAGDKIILYVGRIEPRRNTISLLEVFDKIRKREKVKLVIIGKGNARYMEKCRQLIKAKGLNNDILYSERMEQRFLPQIYQLADLFLLPTSYEIFGMVILEAMFFRTPVLTTLNGGSDILIKNGVSGYILPELDIDRWANKSLDILNKDNSHLTAVAHKTITEEFVWDVLADKFIESFNEKLKIIDHEL